MHETSKIFRQPILKACPEHPWESLCVLNPAVMVREGTFYLLYRAAGHDTEHIIRLGLAKSEDGFHFVRCFDGPVLSPDPDGPDAGGIEDPRLHMHGRSLLSDLRLAHLCAGTVLEAGLEAAIYTAAGRDRILLRKTIP